MLIKAARTMLIYAQAPLFLWAEAVATTCYTQNHSIVRLRHDKTPYELLHGKLPDLSFLHVFGALCYPTNDSENLGKLQPKADIGILIGYAPTKKAFWIYNQRTRQIIETIHIDFDELTAMASEQITPEFFALIAKVIALEPAELTGSPSSTTVDQDAPSPIAHMGNDSLFGMPIPEVASDQSSLTDSIHTVVHPDHQISQHNRKWTKDHPLENIIGQLTRPVSTRLQLHEQALFCYYDAFLTSVEPKTYKDALTQSCWIEAMQEDLNEFEHLKEEVYVSQPDGFVDPDNPNHVNDNDLLLVQMYVDDIIFAASTPELYDIFAKIMCLKFKMSMMGKISFFLGLQISQSPRGIFINQSKYALESLKKYDFESCDPVHTPMVEKFELDEDKEEKVVNPSHYRGSAYQKALTCGKKDLSIPTRNRQSGSMVSEGFFDCFNSICRCGLR
nr:retrotransposon protein, putative, Ty1-copia subclass [Tanacetum cinerariifolium]